MTTQASSPSYLTTPFIASMRKRVAQYLLFIAIGVVANMPAIILWKMVEASPSPNHAFSFGVLAAGFLCSGFFSIGYGLSGLHGTDWTLMSWFNTYAAKDLLKRGDNLQDHGGLIDDDQLLTFEHTLHREQFEALEALSTPNSKHKNRTHHWLCKPHK
jgi:hypothetical protein